mgnify:CR=1 FL=1
MKIPIVNEQDEIICYKERSETTPQDIRRIIRLNVFNENKEILIARRSKNKNGLWGPSVAGHVDEGYDYDSTVVKEAEEEIGLYNIKPIFLKKIFLETLNSTRFTSIYYVIIDSEEFIPKIQEEEVSEVKWISLEDLENWYKEKPQDFISSFSRTMDSIKEVLLIKDK